MKIAYVVFTLFILVEYSEYRGKVSAQIIDGDLVPYIENHNYVVDLYLTRSRDGDLSESHCAGTIVSPWKIVTAAHCSTDVIACTMSYGSTDPDNYPYYTMEIDIDDVFSHPESTGKWPYNHDIAVVRLNTRIIFSTKVGKIDMVDEGYIPKEDEFVKMLGFTQSLNSGSERDYMRSPLRSIDSKVEKFSRCEKFYSENGLNKTQQFCVKLRSGRHNTNRGDSGGPVITSDRKLIGITSYDKDDTAEINTLVSGYRDWIANPTEYNCRYDGQIWETEMYNFMAAILYTKSASSGTCGATILSETKLLTSASCVYDSLSVTLLLATTNTDEPYFAMNVITDEITIHPEFSKGSYPPYANDIAVIQLKKSMKFGKKVGKIDMVATKYTADPGEDVEMLGYSEAEGGHGSSYEDTNLRRINSTIKDFDFCRRTYSGYANLEKRKQLCLVFNNGMYNPNGRYYGGPIITKARELIGITSYSMNGLPHVFTSINGYREFIDNPKKFRVGTSSKQNVHSTGQTSGQTSRSSSSKVPSRQTTTKSDLVRKIEDYNYAVAVLYKDDSDGSRYLCSATIITNSKVLAAAHCVHNKYSVILEFGTLDTDEQYFTVNVSKKEIFVHPEYREKPCYINDIAVIQLKKSLKFDSKIGKIDMVDKNYVIDTDDKVKLLGHSKGVLRYFKSTIHDFVGCRYSYWERDNDNPWLKEERQFCVTVKDGDENIGTGYAGGPVVTAGKKLIGIFSYDSDGLPEVCTSVIGHRAFIDNPKDFRPDTVGSIGRSIKSISLGSSSRRK